MVQNKRSVRVRRKNGSPDVNTGWLKKVFLRGCNGCRAEGLQDLMQKVYRAIYGFALLAVQTRSCGRARNFSWKGSLLFRLEGRKLVVQIDGHAIVTPQCNVCFVN